jgi:hypothetical protein
MTIGRRSALDAPRLNAFLVALGLTQRGQHSIDRTPPGMITAVILFDAAVETAAKATRTAFPPSGFPGDTGYFVKPSRRRQQQTESLPWVFDQLLASHRERVDEAEADLSGLAEVRRMHKYRNEVQHEGLVPSQDDVERQRLRAADFLAVLADQFFGCRLLELSRAWLVEETIVRSRIQAAEQSFEAGDLPGTVKHLAIAFEAARHAFREDQPQDAVHFPKHKVHSVVRDLERRLTPNAATRPIPLGDLERLLDSLIRRTAIAEDRLEALSLGAQASEYLWFRNRFPRVTLAPRGRWDHAPNTSAILEQHDTRVQARWAVSPDPSQLQISGDEALRALDFVVTVALHWQQFPPVPTDDTSDLSDPEE